MNGVQQRHHTTAVQTAERRIDDTVTVLAALSQEILKDRHRQETYAADVDRRLLGVSARLAAFESTGVWQRLRWLFTGEIA